MGKHKDLSEFDKGQIVTARRLSQSISKTAALVGCSWSAVVSIYEKWSKNQRWSGDRVMDDHVIDARGERRLAHAVWSNRWATVDQIAKEVNACSDRKVSKYTVHSSLLGMDHRVMEEGGRSDESRFIYIMWIAGYICVAYFVDTWHQDALWEDGKPPILWVRFCWETSGPAIHVDVLAAKGGPTRY